MNRLISVALVALLCIYGYQRYREARLAQQPVAQGTPAAGHQTASPVEVEYEPARSEPTYKCDGRQYCSQMHSCDEATWMIRNCPGMKMDGDNDGVPCERGPC